MFMCKLYGTQVTGISGNSSEIQHPCVFVSVIMSHMFHVKHIQRTFHVIHFLRNLEGDAWAGPTLLKVKRNRKLRNLGKVDDSAALELPWHLPCWSLLRHHCGHPHLLPTLCGTPVSVCDEAIRFGNWQKISVCMAL